MFTVNECFLSFLSLAGAEAAQWNLYGAQRTTRAPRAGGRAAPGGHGSLEMDLREKGEEAVRTKEKELRTPSTS